MATMKSPSLLVILATAVAVGSASATPSLRLTDLVNGNSVTIADQQAGLDLDNSVGRVQWSGLLDSSWSATVGLGNNASFGLAAPAPYLELNAYDLTSQGGSLQILFSDVGFTSSPQGLEMGVSGDIRSGTVITYKLWADAYNQAFATSTLLGSITWADGFGAGGFGSFDGTGPYSLTMEVDISFPAAEDKGNDGQPVPDGGLTMTLLGIGLAGLALVRRRLEG
jgi:hypothetical protein